MSQGAGPGEQNVALSDLPEVANTLVRASVAGRQRRELCMDLLAAGDPGSNHVIYVTYRDRPRDLVAAWNDYVGEEPATGGIVAVGQGEQTLETPRWAVSTVPNNGDLTGIGIELSDMLSDTVEETADQEEIRLCFDSVTTLLQYTDLQRAFRFLHVVTGRVRNAEARAFYHLNPESHDTQDTATLTSLFDIEIDQNGDTWTIRS